MIVEELVSKLGLEIDSGAFAKGEAVIKALEKGFFAFGAAVTAAFAVGAVAITRMTSNAADHAKKLAQSTGVDADTIQRLAYAADLSDVSIESLSASMRFMAKKGTKDVRGEMLRLADVFQKLPSDGAKVALAIEKFGKAGAGMIPFLNGGRKEIEALMEEAGDLGIVFDKVSQDEAEEFNDTVTLLGYALRGLGYKLGKMLIKPLKRLVRSLIEGVKALRNFHVSTLQVERGIVALAATLGILTIAYAKASAAAVLGWIRAALPVIAMIALVGLLLLVIDDVLTFFSGEGKSVIGEFVDYVYKEFGGFLGFFKDVGKWLFDIWAHAFEKTLTFIGNMLGLEKDLFKGFGDWLSEHMAEVGTEAARALWRGFKLVASTMPGIGTLLAAADVASAAGGLFGGGAASPAASASSSVSSVSKRVNNNQRNYVTVQGSPNPQETADAITGALDRHWDSQLLNAKMGLE